MCKRPGPPGIERILMMNPPLAGERDLLLEERRDHDSGAPAVFEALDGIEIESER
jgi:hypothetical protein